jgi:NAD(P)-dependent dehydrogenase (short-subunit alcohol dehydrogenase family)
MKQFKGKVAVITGAASGIGKGIAERCVKEGMNVVLADVNGDDLIKTESELKALGGMVIGVKTDVSKRNEMEHLAKKALDTFGGVHLLFNNAGVSSLNAVTTPWDASWNDWEWVVGVNLWGVINGIKIFTPIMLNQNTEGHIVNTASLAGLVVGTPPGPYSVTKHAVVALSESIHISLEYRKALIKVSVLCPGFVNTNIMNAERNRPDELKNPPVEIPPQLQSYIDFMKTSIESGISPQKVADQVFEAIKKEQFYIMTHPEYLPAVRMRLDSIINSENPKSLIDMVTKTKQPGA